MKYKPCCNRRCLLASCKTREAGGCYCLCGLIDALQLMESISEGNTLAIGDGFVYFPNGVPFLTEKQKKEQEEYLKTIPDKIKKIKDKIDTYRING